MSTYLSQPTLPDRILRLSVVSFLSVNANDEDCADYDIHMRVSSSVMQDMSDLVYLCDYRISLVNQYTDLTWGFPFPFS